MHIMTPLDHSKAARVVNCSTPRFSTELVNIDPADLKVGKRVKPVFCDYPDHDVTMLRYEPA